MHTGFNPSKCFHKNEKNSNYYTNRYNIELDICKTNLVGLINCAWQYLLSLRLLEIVF